VSVSVIFANESRSAERPFLGVEFVVDALRAAAKEITSGTLWVVTVGRCNLTCVSYVAEPKGECPRTCLDTRSRPQYEGIDILGAQRTTIGTNRAIVHLFLDQFRKSEYKHPIRRL
jgi:hypothetical protein